jgi:putative ABC transport system permease protein
LDGKFLRTSHRHTLSTTVIRNYFAAALRNLDRHRLYAVVTMVALGIGLTASLLIGLYIRDEYRFDHWIEGHDQVYRVAMGLELNGTRIAPSAGAAAPLAQWLQADYPEIAVTARLRADQRRLRHEATEGTETVYWSDPSIFDVLPLPQLAGKARDALLAPDAVVVTRRVARKYFHVDDPVGQVLLIDGSHAFRIAAVLADLPIRTHLATEIFASARNQLATLPPPGTPLRLDVSFDELTSALTYLRLRPGSDPQRLQQTLQQQMLAHVPIPRGPDGKPLVPAPVIYLQPLDEIHFVPAGAHAMRAAGDPRLLRWVGTIAVLILLVALINFATLLAAHGLRRAPEIGLRKLAGARRRHVFAQFLCEAAVLIAVALLCAGALVECLLPHANAMLGRDMRFDWWRDPQLALVLAGLGMLFTLAGAAYPAFALSRIEPADTLHGAYARHGRPRAWRDGMLGLQFASLIGLMIVTSAVYLQSRFAAGSGLGFDTARVFMLEHSCDGALPDALRAANGVAHVACSDARFGIDGGSVFVSTPPDGSAPVAVSYVAVDAGLLESLGLKPSAGRFFERSRPADVTPLVGGDARTGDGGAAVINEAALRRLGFASAEAAIGQPVQFGQNASRPPTIIGVVADFPLFGARRQVQPVVFRVTPGGYRYLLVKLEGGDAAALQSVRNTWDQVEGGRPFKGQMLDAAIRLSSLDVLRQTQLFALFTAVTLVIACLGLFGQSVHHAALRTREIGIRKALGAGTRDVLCLLLWQFSRPVVLANLLAWPVAAWLLQRWLAGFAYHIYLSWWLFALPAFTALLIALAVVGVQSLRAARARPIRALRHE